MSNIDILIKLALKEDIGSGDVTSLATIPKDGNVKARIIAKEKMIVAGINVMALVFKTIDKKIKIKAKVEDGNCINKRTIIAELNGPARSILTAERTALNFLQRLSGIATLTGKFVSAVRGTKVKITDTRKTTPGWRALEKYAVKTGGGINHRMGLYDMYLIKNNHIDIAGSVTNTILAVRRSSRGRLLIEVEVRNLKELKEAVALGPDTIMLDNFSLKMAKKAFKIVKNRLKIEISGGISLKNVKKYVKTGVNFISVGSITHSAPAADIHLAILRPLDFARGRQAQDC